MTVDVVHVVVPAHDEEALLGACLASIATASTRLTSRRPRVVVRTTVVLDRCTDGTAAVAAAYGVDTVVVDATSVGVARAAGVEQAAALADGHPPERVLVASTDADCVVPELWLADLHALAQVGHDLVVGAVHPDPADLPTGVLDRWRDRHRVRGTHVHGANLAFTLAAYARAGDCSRWTCTRTCCWSRPCAQRGAGGRPGPRCRPRGVRPAGSAVASPPTWRRWPSSPTESTGPSSVRRTALP